MIFGDREFMRKIYNSLDQGELYREKMTFEAFFEQGEKFAESVFCEAFEDAEKYVSMLCEGFRIDKLKDFHLKKQLTSAFRRVAPIGLTTNILVTANHRAWRHMIEMRTSEGAEEEIREVFLKVAGLFSKAFSNLYQDMVIRNDRATFECSKV